MGTTVRLGFIGAGSIGNVHMEAFHGIPGAALEAVADTVQPLAEAAAVKYGIAKVFDSPGALLADGQIDAVIVGVPNKWHAEITLEALLQGKHVLVEKPMGIHTQAARQIVEAQRKTGKVVLVGHQWRWEWLSLAIQKQVAKGEMGRVYAAKAGWFRRKGIPGWGTWFTQKGVSGGGPLIDIGVHMLDLSLWLMGNPKPVAVSGATFAAFGPSKKGIGSWGKPDWSGYCDVEDMAMALIKMEDGSALTLEVSWAVHMDTDAVPYIHLLGSEGGASWHLNRGKFLAEKFDQPMEAILEKPANDVGSRARLCEHFLACVRGEAEPLTSAATGLTNNMILDGIYESSQSGREVRLEW